jgi:hypothetical protein
VSMEPGVVCGLCCPGLEQRTDGRSRQVLRADYQLVVLRKTVLYQIHSLLQNGRSYGQKLLTLLLVVHCLC